MNIFRQVAMAGSFTKAADNLGRPKSSISTAISRLEAHLGLRLLERTTRRIKLTDAGLNLYTDSAEHLDGLHDLMLSAQTQSQSISGTLRLAAPYEFGAHHLASIAARLMAEHSDLRIIMDVKYGPADFFDTNYDIMFSLIDQELPNSSLVMKKVFELHRGIFASPEFLRQHATPLRPENLEKLPLLCAADERTWQFTSSSRDDEPIIIDVGQPRLNSSNADFRKRAALEGVGVIRVTSTFCQNEVENGTLIQLLPDYQCQPLKVIALMPTRRLTLPRVRLFLDTLTSEKNAGN
ncbi:MAG: LysR family transcriptional regulator [Rhizobiaceae bacterium]